MAAEAAAITNWRFLWLVYTTQAQVLQKSLSKSATQLKRWWALRLGTREPGTRTDILPDAEPTLNTFTDS